LINENDQVYTTGGISTLKKTVVTLSMAAVVGLSTIFAGVPANVLASDKLTELNQKSEELQGKKSEVKKELNQTNEQINEIEEEQNRVTNELKRLETQINDTNTKITEKNQQIEETKGEIEQLKNEIVEIEKRIEIRNELLKDRARAYQEGGGINYIDVLVGANSFGDLIDRIDAVATIVEADQTIINEHNADKAKLEENKASIEQELNNLQKMQQELESLKATLDGQKEEQNNLMAMLEQQKSEAVDVQYTLEEQQRVIEGQDAAIQKAIELEQQRQAELKKEAELKKQAELKRQQEEAAKQKQQVAAAKTSGSNTNSSTSSSSSSSSNNKVAASAAPVSSSNFIRPTQGVVTSGFGYRIHPVSGGKKFHHGVDIAKAGTVPVVASASGVVSYSGQMSGYGNVIIITHSINGKTYETLYAHLRNLGVGSMQTVSQGQTIGYMGNTGIGTGQHLHFEVHNGRWNGAKSNAVNPSSVVPI
jgi:peptidoglycan hydrolase CwlO-like protein